MSAADRLLGPPGDMAGGADQTPSEEIAQKHSCGGTGRWLLSGLLVLLVALLTRTIAHELHDRDLGYGLDGNLSEFRELVMYYLGLVYTIHLARRSPEGLASETQSTVTT